MKVGSNCSTAKRFSVGSRRRRRIGKWLTGRSLSIPAKSECSARQRSLRTTCSRSSFAPRRARTAASFCTPSAEPKDPTTDCLELNIAGEGVSPFTTGSLVGRKKTEKIHENADWQAFEVTLDGEKFVVKLDGEEVLSYVDPKPLGRGLIGLQHNMRQGRVPQHQAQAARFEIDFQRQRFNRLERAERFREQIHRHRIRRNERAAAAAGISNRKANTAISCCNSSASPTRRISTAASSSAAFPVKK